MPAAMMPIAPMVSTATTTFLPTLGAIAKTTAAKNTAAEMPVATQRALNLDTAKNTRHKPITSTAMPAAPTTGTSNGQSKRLRTVLFTAGSAEILSAQAEIAHSSIAMPAKTKPMPMTAALVAMPMMVRPSPKATSTGQ